MANQKRDLLDDLIDIQSDWQALSNPFGDIADSLAADPSQRKVFNPADYKEKPFANSNRCLCTASDRDDVCTRCALCVDRCPTGVIILGKVGEPAANGDFHQRTNTHGYGYGMRLG